MAYKEGYLFKEGGIRHNIKKRWTVVDASGITYYKSSAVKDKAKPLGHVPAQTILSTCELGVKKKQDFCVEVATAERNWIFWALDTDSLKSWIAAFEQAKQAGIAAKQAGGGMPVATVAETEEKRGGLLSKLSLGGRGKDEDEDFISSDEDEAPKKVMGTPGKKAGFVEQPYTSQIEVIQIKK